MKIAFILGALIGLIVSGAILALMWFGVSGILSVGHSDLGYVFWPSSILLTTGWRTTPTGIMITIRSVMINCFLYGLVGLVVRFFVRSLRRLFART